MKLIINENTEPFLNMAIEERLLRVCEEPAVMLWRNEPAVIVGRNQNIKEQVNLGFTGKNGIAVVRRLSGGGAVFHDLGNVNYTFVFPSDGLSLRFAELSEPVLAALASLGVRAELSGRNDIISSGHKFSGTAQCVYPYLGRKRLLHHGTLLFSSDFSYLEGALNADEEKMRSKGIKSVRSRVVNISSLITGEHAGMSCSEFKAYLERSFVSGGAYVRGLSDEDIAEAELLKREKYESEEWLFPKRYETGEALCYVKKRFDFGTVEIRLEGGSHISRAGITGDFFGCEDIHGLEAALEGCKYERSAVFERLSLVNPGKYITGADALAITDMLF